MINGVTFIHGERYIHRDLETSNVFIDGDGVCKIGDLENAVFMGDRLEYIEKVVCSSLLLLLIFVYIHC